MKIKKIISGMQTGVDQAALIWAKSRGFEVGGFAPKGFITTKGPMPKFAAEYNIEETHTSSYVIRTIKNIINSDATLIIVVNIRSKGTELATDVCLQRKKPFLIVCEKNGNFDDDQVKSTREWLEEETPTILNIGGNREEIFPEAKTIIPIFLDKVFNLKQPNTE